jgi:hypothetical protein
VLSLRVFRSMCGVRLAGLAGLVVISCLSPGCTERLSLGGLTGTSTPEPEPLATPGGAATPLADTGARRPPPINMAGRWTLNSPGAGGCAMNFGALAGASEGTIAPEGGCPGNFFTSRKWVFEESGLVIRDHTGQPLAQLAFAPPSRFDGRTTSGQAVTLTR